MTALNRLTQYQIFPSKPQAKLAVDRAKASRLILAQRPPDPPPVRETRLVAQALYSCIRVTLIQ